MGYGIPSYVKSIKIDVEWLPKEVAKYRRFILRLDPADIVPEPLPLKKRNCPGLSPVRDMLFMIKGSEPLFFRIQDPSRGYPKKVLNPTL
jgi:hypothetical protein